SNTDKWLNCDVDQGIGANCSLNPVIGKIYANSDTCTLGNQDKCQVQINWNSYGSNNVIVKIRENNSFNFGETPAGQRPLDITASGAHFDLYINGAVVD